MPYISKELRQYIDNGTLEPRVPGTLSYAITRLLLNYWEKSSQDYGVLAEISGVMTETLAEFRRRVIQPYEDKKCWDNGDIFEDVL